MRNRLSLCMIVRNEERDLSRCLDSVRDLAREFVIVDTGSTDATIDIAMGYGAEVIPFDFSFVDFSAARNHAIAHATGRWILMLDADEILDRASAPALEKLVALDDNVGYYLERRNHFSGENRFTTDYVVRLFPNRPACRFRGRVHETVDASILEAGGQLRRSDIRLDHNFSSLARDRTRKNHWYLAILNEEIAANPQDSSRLDFLAAEYHQLGMFEEAAAVTERIAELRPRDPKAHLFLGAYRLVYQKDPARAKADFVQALILQPGLREAESFLTLCE